MNNHVKECGNNIIYKKKIIRCVEVLNGEQRPNINLQV